MFATTMWSLTSSRYRPVPKARESTSSEDLSESEEKSSLLAPSPITKATQRSVLLAALISIMGVVILLQSATLLYLVLDTRLTTVKDLHRCDDGQYDRDWYNISERNADLKATSSYSPVFDAVDLDIRLKTFNGVFRDNISIWRMAPSPQVDEAWDYVSAEGFELIMVSSEDILSSGKDPSITIQAPPSWGAGSDAYFAQIDVFHQIHCLNMLRKGIFSEYYYYDQDGTADSVSEEFRRTHQMHCIHMLLQTLMCSADVGIITHNWVHNEKLNDPKTRPFPDFNVVKKCRDFDALLGWVREKGVKDVHARFSKLMYPTGAPIVPGDGYV